MKKFRKYLLKALKFKGICYTVKQVSRETNCVSHLENKELE